ERTFPIRQGQTDHGPRGIAAVHLFRHLLDHSGLTLSKLAHTRLSSGRGGGGASPDAGREVGKRFSMTCCGVRTQGVRVKTVATVAMRFLLAFCPLVSRALGCAPQGLTMGMPLASTAATRIAPAAVATERCW